MQLSFYDASVLCYQQILDSTAKVLEKGQAHAAANNQSLDEIVEYRLHESMLPFSFQVISVWHHSYGAINGMREGVFSPPPKKPNIDYAGLCALVDEAREFMAAETQESMEALSGKNMCFKMGEMEIPFTTDKFLATFSKPNFYFHATTTYAILRALGTPLGKMDYLGNMAVGH
ncbi:MAG: DUF1993 domain-containing protein [Luminiphilus sp.]|jgi:hypothetical protein